MVMSCLHYASNVVYKCETQVYHDLSHIEVHLYIKFQLFSFNHVDFYKQQTDRHTDRSTEL